MNLLPDWAPNVHPMFVHFPVGLLFTAVFVDLLSLFFGSREWLRRGAVVLYLAGAAAALPAYLSGRYAADDVIVPAAAEAILTEHETYALWTLLFFGAYALIRLAVELVTRGGRRWLRIALFALALPGAFLVWETAEHGSEMVYGYGVGVRETAEPVTAKPSTGESGVEINEHGWRWLPATEATLHDSLLWWMEGAPADLELRSAADSAAGVWLRPRSVPLAIAVRRDLADVQLTAEIDPTGASVMLVHHVQQEGGFDFLELQDGQLHLGRITNGERTVYESAQISESGLVRVRAVGDGTHFRGYVNDRLLVHGHADTLPPGPAGLRVTGGDSLLIRYLAAETL